MLGERPATASVLAYSRWILGVSLPTNQAERRAVGCVLQKERFPEKNAGCAVSMRRFRVTDVREQNCRVRVGGRDRRA